MSGPEQTGGSVVLTGSERNTRLNVAMTNRAVKPSIPPVDTAETGLGGLGFGWKPASRSD